MAETPNRLISEQSPYLLQHAYNPVDWHPWGPQAFAIAKSQDKPILLSIGYATCHWCHVMAHESFEDKDIAGLINAHFIPIKVDREERADIDHIYMTAVTAMSGQGGWPLTVFLTSDGKPFYGGTYFPPYAKWGSPGFADLLTNIAQGWLHNRSEILESGHALTQALQARALQDVAQSGLNHVDLLHRAYRQMSGQFDEINGGFGNSPKFPMGHNLSLLLRYHKDFNESKALSMVERTLHAMADGGIYDHLGGGFHRYATDQQWQVPHFEKMLYDQALLSRAYLEAFQVTGDLFYADVARDILAYVLSQMQDPDGGFYSAQDADSLSPGADHATEGAFYIFTAQEIKEALGERDDAIFSFCYGIEANGNVGLDPHGEFTAKNILYLAKDAASAAVQFNLSVEAIEDVLAKARSVLLTLRNGRPHPLLDDKVMVDWNGLMIASLSFASRVLDDQSYVQAAVRGADFILGQMLVDGQLLHRWRKGQAAIPATLEDYAFFIYGLLELYEASFDNKYLQQAQDLTASMMELFEDDKGGFFMTAQGGEELIFRPKEAYDGAIPSGNSVAALSLLHLYGLTGKEIYQLSARRLMSFFSPTVEASPSAYGFLLSAMAFDMKGAWEVLLEGPLVDAPAVAKMVRIVYKCFRPYMALRYRHADHVRAYVCHCGVCRMPVNNIDVLELTLADST